jgi:hypothetical protein
VAGEIYYLYPKGGADMMFDRFSFEGVARRSICYKGGSGEAKRVITEDQVAAAEVAAKQWNDYQTRYVPFENKFVEHMNKPVESKEKAVRGMVNADVQQSVSKVAPVDPNRGMAPTGTVPVAAAKAKAAGMVDATKGAVDAEAQGLGTVVALGRGQQVEALNGLTDQASASGQIANAKMLNDVQSSINERGRVMGNVGTALGMAAGAAKAGMSGPVNAPGAGVGGTYGQFGSPEVGVEYNNPYYSGD